MLKGANTMTDLMIFDNPEFGKIRTIEENGKVLFCAKDVAIALGYKDSTNAIKQHCRGVVKRHLKKAPRTWGSTTDCAKVGNCDYGRFARVGKYVDRCPKTGRRYL